MKVWPIAALLLLLGFHPAFAQDYALRTVSSRPDAVSGGDVLVALRAPKDAKWVVELNGRDVSASFQAAEGSEDLVALLGGLKEGKNLLEVTAGGAVKAKLEILDYPLTGPIFTGPQQQPYLCETAANGLGPADDASCSARTLIQYFYKSTEPVTIPPVTEFFSSGWTAAPDKLAAGFNAFDPSAPLPADMAKTVTSDGRTVNFIVRREMGTLNRAVFEIEFLYQPGQPLPTPWSRPSGGWNRRLVFLTEGGCGGGHHQGTFIGPIGSGSEPFLGLGYATATSTLNRYATTCDDKLAAETLSMVKEHFIKEYGEPVHTMGLGGSGGAMELELVAQNYPGLFDGILPWVSFPDIVTTAQSVTDCQLLDHALGNVKAPWTEKQKTAVEGFAEWRTCSENLKGFILADPEKFCPTILPKTVIYDPVTNPKGVRCDIYDNEITFFGRDPKTGFARRPLDNVGVQYGLVAFNAGKIDAEQFIELNERIGGLDRDANFMAARMEADPETLHIAYRRGLALTGGGGLGETPIIDWRPYSDDMADNHDFFRSFVTRARLVAANGNADNQVIVVYPRHSLVGMVTWMATQRFEAPFMDRERVLIRQMDHWLDNIAADTAPGTAAAKAARNKPADLGDACWAADGERIAEPASYDGQGRCHQLYPPHADARIAAGGPLADDVLKCALKPVDPAAYAQPLSADQLRRLKAVFPAGVCDYSRPGIGQEVTRTTWQRFGAR